MPHEPNPALFDDAEDLGLAALARRVREECDALAEALPAALALQWSPAPIPKPREDTTERAKGGHGDPTAAVALDPARLALRAQVLASERVLRQAIVTAKGVRLGLEHALSRWDD